MNGTGVELDPEHHISAGVPEALVIARQLEEGKRGEEMRGGERIGGERRGVENRNLITFTWVDGQVNH